MAQCIVKLSVHPSRALVDEKFKVVVQKAAPGANLTVQSHHLSENKHHWEAFGHYICDNTGTINLCEDPSLGGTYCGVEPMGLLWSLRPVPGSPPGLRLRVRDVESPMEVMISVYQGHISEGFSKLKALAAVLVERWYMALGVQRIPVTEHNLTATLFLPPGHGPFPAVLDLWGLGGGLVEYRASLLASNGFAALALNYLNSKLTESTGEMVESDYFEAAYKFLQQHPQVEGSRIAIIGLSFGTTVALKMLIYSDVMKLRCAVCYSGTHIQPVNASVKELLKYFYGTKEDFVWNEKQEAIWRHTQLPVPENTAFKVDVGRLECPLMLIVGLDDQNCPSFEAALDMKEMLEKARKSHLLTVLTYPDAGHLIEPPYSPHTRSSIFKAAHIPEKRVILWGGETTAHSRAQEDAWRKTLVFLREHLISNNGSNFSRL